MVDFHSQSSPSMLPGPTPAGRAPTATHLHTCSGENPRLVRPVNSLASNGSIPLPTVLQLPAGSEPAAWVQCEVQACALQILALRRDSLWATSKNLSSRPR